VRGEQVTLAEESNALGNPMRPVAIVVLLAVPSLLSARAGEWLCTKEGKPTLEPQDVEAEDSWLCGFVKGVGRDLSVLLQHLRGRQGGRDLHPPGSAQKKKKKTAEVSVSSVQDPRNQPTGHLLDPTPQATVAHATMPNPDPCTLEPCASRPHLAASCAARRALG